MKAQNTSLAPALARVSRLHIVLAIIFAVQIVVYDASKLITPDVVLKRWAMVAILFVSACLVWYIASPHSSKTVTHDLLWLLILIDIAIVSYSIYLQRGMASRAVLLYVIPIISAAILVKRSALLLTAALSVAAYMVTTIAYFVLNFNEGYKVELYGEVLFYSAILFTVAGLVGSVLKTSKKS